METNPDLVTAVPAPEPMRPRPLSSVKRDTRDGRHLLPRPRARRGRRGFPFGPGQFNMLYVFGVGEVPISISGDPGRPETLVHTIRAVGAVTRALQSLERGDLVGVRGPLRQRVARGGGPRPRRGDRRRGASAWLPCAPPSTTSSSTGASTDAWCCSTARARPGDILYPRELRQWRGRFDMEVEVTVDRATTDWQGVRRGRDEAHRARALRPRKHHGLRLRARGDDPLHGDGLQQRGVARRSILISMERNMKCGVGLCGHCQFGPSFICREGPVFRLRPGAALVRPQGGVTWGPRASPSWASSSSPRATAASSRSSTARTSCSPLRAESTSPTSPRPRGPW